MILAGSAYVLASRAARCPTACYIYLAAAGSVPTAYKLSLPVKLDGSSRVGSGWGALPSSWGFGFTFGVLGLPSSLKTLLMNVL